MSDVSTKPDASVLQVISDYLNDAFKMASVSPVGGSSLNSIFRIDGERASYFIKLNKAEFTSMMEAEFAGLQELAGAASVRVPEPLTAGRAGQSSFLAMEWLDIGPGAPEAHASFGHRLAVLHQHTGAQFGWHRDNTIGLTKQINTYTSDWGRFFCDYRLAVQLELLQLRGFNELVERGRELQQRLPAFFAGQDIQPSLLHGDLWGGNWGALSDGTPVMFDPAVYYGDAESDIAMTLLFGGFSSPFYAAYREVHAETADGAMRRDLYQLYHLLNHCNLFGRSYHAQTNTMLSRLLVEL